MFPSSYFAPTYFSSYFQATESGLEADTVFNAIASISGAGILFTQFDTIAQALGATTLTAHIETAGEGRARAKSLSELTAISILENQAQGVSKGILQGSGNLLISFDGHVDSLAFLTGNSQLIIPGDTELHALGLSSSEYSYLVTSEALFRTLALLQGAGDTQAIGNSFLHSKGIIATVSLVYTDGAAAFQQITRLYGNLVAILAGNGLFHSISLQNEEGIPVTIGNANIVSRTLQAVSGNVSGNAAVTLETLGVISATIQVETLADTEFLALTLKLKRYINPDIVLGIGYIRTSILGEVLLRTSLLDTVKTRTSLQDKVATRSSILENAYTRQSTKSENFTKTIKTTEQEL